MNGIVQYLQENIVLLLFLIIGLGHLVDKLKLGSVALGSTTGILVVGLLIGLLHFDVPPIVKGLSFTLYLFVLGVSIGPGMIHMLTTRAAFKYLVLALFTGVAMFVSVFFVAKVFDLNNVVGGLSSGAMTTSAVLAAAQNAIAAGGIKLPDGMSAKDAGALLGGINLEGSQAGMTNRLAENRGKVDAGVTRKIMDLKLYDADGKVAVNGGCTKPINQDEDITVHQVVIDVKRRQMWLKCPNPSVFADWTHFDLKELWD